MSESQEFALLLFVILSVTAILCFAAVRLANWTADRIERKYSRNPPNMGASWDQSDYFQRKARMAHEAAKLDAEYKKALIRLSLTLEAAVKAELDSDIAQQSPNGRR